MQPDFSKQQGEQKCQRLCALRSRARDLGSHLSKTLTLNVCYPYTCVLDGSYLAKCVL